MGAFSNTLRDVATKLITDLGNPCVLTRITKGSYIPSLGETPISKKEYPTFSAPVKKVSVAFGQTGINTNLGGFDDNKVIVPWIGQEIDETWRYDDMNIVKVEPTRTQGDIVIYTITVGEVE